MKPRDVAASLKALGFSQVRQRGPHTQYRHPNGTCTTLPFHAVGMFLRSC
ncbi:MAG: type II toxin-antitoxin system HicA family toxin [Phycisphaerae bacterium]